VGIGGLSKQIAEVASRAALAFSNGRDRRGFFRET
jgi:hypothetical protein